MQPVYIGPYDLGAQKNLEPFYIPEKAFPTLTNAFIFRGRVQKKPGFVQLGRLRRCFEEINYLKTEASPWAFNILSISGYVIGANNANPGEITTSYPHNLMTGDIVILTDVGGATGYNNIEFTITVTGINTFTVGVDAAGFGAYTSGGFWISNRSLLTNEPNATIVPGSLEFTLPGPILITDQGDGTLTSTTAGNSGTIDYVTGDVVLTHTVGAGQDVLLDYCYFPALPVMGLCNYERDTLNFEDLIAFDTVYAYRFTGGAFSELSPGTTWSGTDSDFFWFTNYFQDGSNNPLFWVTNFSGTGGDPIRYWNNSTWTDFFPTINGVNELHQSRILIPYKDRLIALNTFEGATLNTSVNFPQRARWSQNGDPTDTTNGWRDDIVGRGGFVDAPTNQQIVSVGLIKDQLIVYFERSTWQLVYTGNEVLPFVWKQINSELGAEATFSRVPFDNGLIAMGQSGLHTTNGFSVERIDAIIPGTTYTINNFNDGPERVYGIRDYFNELAYWTYPEQQDFTAGNTYPNKVLVYNYRNNTFSFFNESFTCYGYFQRSDNLTWDTLPYESWDQWDAPWDSGVLQSRFPDVIAGNQQGFVVQLIPNTAGNEATRQITAVNTGTNTITSPEHNLFPGDFVYITGAIGIVGLNGNIFEILTTTNDTFTIDATLSGTYLGGGEITVLSNINIKTRMFNFFWPQGKRVRCVQIDFLLDRTADGEFSVNFFVDQTNTFSLSNTTLSSLLGQSGSQNHVWTKPEPDTFNALQNQASQIWHRMFTYGQGQEFQLQFFMDSSQMTNLNIAQAPWVLHGMILYILPDGDLL